MSRRPTIAELRWPETPEFVEAAEILAENVVTTMTNALWDAYDSLRNEVLALLGAYEVGDEMERQVTLLLHPWISAALTGFEPFTCQHAQREFETRMPAPAQAPEYDLAFVLRANPRISWPAEAKVVATDGTIAAYVADITDQYMTCRYAPFSSGGAMLAYLIAGTPETFFDNVGGALACSMETPPWSGSRSHRFSIHQRDVPEGKPYPRKFECHHLVMPIRLRNAFG
jgi:hypothetical protein